MRNRRRNWLLRRLVLGLAVAAIVAPAASARVYEVGTAQSDGGSSAVIKGDDKVIAGVEGSGIVIDNNDHARRWRRGNRLNGGGRFSSAGSCVVGSPRGKANGEF